MKEKRPQDWNEFMNKKKRWKVTKEEEEEEYAGLVEIV